MIRKLANPPPNCLLPVPAGLAVGLAPKEWRYETGPIRPNGGAVLRHQWFPRSRDGGRIGIRLFPLQTRRYCTNRAETAQLRSCRLQRGRQCAARAVVSVP